MNASVAIEEQDSAVELIPSEVRNSVRALLASPIFSKAPRMCHLLSFLMEKKLSGREQEISEMQEDGNLGGLLNVLGIKAHGDG